MNKDTGASASRLGSRASTEPSSTVSALPGFDPSREATHYVVNNRSWVGVKEAEFFRSQGGLTAPWGKNWKPVSAPSIGAARRIGAAMFGITLSHIYLGER